MSTLVVCLRSRLLSQAVADLVSADNGLAAAVAAPEDVATVVEGTDDLAGVFVDGHTARHLDGALPCPVVVLGQRADDAAGRAVLAGLPLHVDGVALLGVLHALAAGELESEPPSGPAVDRGRRAGDGSLLLTRREQEVLELVADAVSPAEIASALSVSEHTVRTHVQNLLGKLGASSKVDAVARARSLGLLDAGRGR